jgi:hypothetical protein
LGTSSLNHVRNPTFDFHSITEVPFKHKSVTIKKKAKFDSELYHFFYSGGMPLFTVAGGMPLFTVAGGMPLFTIAGGLCLL